MNKIVTALSHSAIAVVIQLALWQVIGITAGGAVAIAFYVGREITQHEYKLGIQRGWQWGQKLPVEPAEGVYNGWSKDSVYDLLFPVAACAIVSSVVVTFVP